MGSPAYRFGEFWLDPAIRELWRGDEQVQLPPKAFGCLAYLIEHRDRAVGRDELISAVWGKMALTDSVVNHAILAARRALGDTGDEHQLIKTVPGFGYRWAAPVVVARASPEADPAWRGWRLRRWLPLAVVVVIALFAGSHFLWRNAQSPGDGDNTAWPVGDDDIGLLLPVMVESQQHHHWIRFGVMELIAERLREAGQPMVPSETVIALVRDFSDQPDAAELETLTAATGARLVFGARAQAVGAGWRVSLRSLTDQQPPMTAFAEADDVLEAAAVATDRLALLLGLTPAPQTRDDPELVLLLQQIEAARLAQQVEVARALIKDAEPRFRQHSEFRFQWGRLEFYGGNLDATQAILEALLDDLPEDEILLRARVLNGLAATHATRGEGDAARPLVERAIGLFGAGDAPPVLGLAHTNLGALLQEGGDFDMARSHLAQARRIYESIGDVLGIAVVDLNVGALAAQRERYAEAARYFERSALGYAAAHDVGGELNARSRMMWAHLFLLDLGAAKTIEHRVSELIEQAGNPRLVSYANLYQVYLLDALGQTAAARDLLERILEATSEVDEALYVPRMSALVRAAENAYRDGAPERAAELAAEVVEKLAADQRIVQNNVRGRGWLLLIRARLALGELAAAAREAASMDAWSAAGVSRSPRIYAHLAAAELAAAEDRDAAAGAAYALALAQADDSQVPLYLLHVAASYVPWLLDPARRDPRRVEQALNVAARLADVVDRYYEAALLQLYVYHAAGPPSAWRGALSRAQALAGEREIPPELLSAP